MTFTDTAFPIVPGCRAGSPQGRPLEGLLRDKASSLIVMKYAEGTQQLELRRQGAALLVGRLLPAESARVPKGSDRFEVERGTLRPTGRIYSRARRYSSQNRSRGRARDDGRS